MQLTAFATRAGWVAATIAVVVLLSPSGAHRPAPESAYAASLPSGFREVVAFSGLDTPTAVRFSANGRIFVAEKSGVIKVFDSLTDTTPTVFADLNAKVYNFWDRGLLGLEVHPQFPSQPYVYALYSHDAAIGGAGSPLRERRACTQRSRARRRRAQRQDGLRHLRVACRG